MAFIRKIWLDSLQSKVSISNALLEFVRQNKTNFSKISKIKKKNQENVIF